MKYNYTWNHLLLFAKMCGSIEDGESVTASWVNIIEEHHGKTFPFTMWPLTYRTSDVTTSPSISSPLHITSRELDCAYDVKIYRCNEVVIVCITEDTRVESCHTCASPRDYDMDQCQDDEHGKTHSNTMSKPLLPCNVAHCYFKMRDIVIEALDDFNNENSDPVKCIICIGHDFSAMIASCFANEIGKNYEAQRIFLGLDKKDIDVDFIGFSKPILASSSYWEMFEGSVDKYITIDNVKENNRSNSKIRLIVNPQCSNIIIERPMKLKRSQSFMKINIRQPRLDDNITSVDIEEYIRLLENKIKVNLNV